MLQASEKKLREHQQFVADTEKRLVEFERALAEKESRLKILRQLNEEGEGLAQGSQAVLKGLDDPARIRAALGGALVSNLDVDPEYVAAIEAALAAHTLTEARVKGLEPAREILLARASGRTLTRVAQAFIDLALERLA